MTTMRSIFPVHAIIARTGDLSAEYDDARAGHPLGRRINRIERVAAAYAGRIVSRQEDGLIMVFDTADAAVLAACEMQHRCTILPQVSRIHFTLRVGVHQGVLHQRATDGGDDSTDIAVLLAMIDDGIVISHAIFDLLSPALQAIAHPLPDTGTDFPVFRINWRSEMPSVALSGGSVWVHSRSAHPVGSYLLLHSGIRTIELSGERGVLRVGRDPASELVLADAHVSRHHCTIQILSGGIVLTDTSTNGTSVLPDYGAEFLVKKESATLKGKGWLLFGRPFKGDRRGGVRYEAF